ncbi:MAG: hypothetical protein KDA87_24665, partial [Planctomycetales bacterium]|nr:hypothetical protein [Planctomycetales bacterium]
MIRQRLLFPLPPKKRGKYRKLMHVCDAVDGLVRFRCKRCKHETDWIPYSPWKAKRGVPCLFC